MTCPNTNDYAYAQEYVRRVTELTVYDDPSPFDTVDAATDDDAAEAVAESFLDLFPPEGADNEPPDGARLEACREALHSWLSGATVSDLDTERDYDDA